MSLAALAVTATTAHAAVLSVDFGNTNFGSVTQAGFELFNADGNSSSSDTRIYSTDSGDVDVTVNGKRTADGIDGLFNRSGVTDGGALTYAAIYNDFAYDNAASGETTMELVLSGAGITADTAYALTFYSYDTDATVTGNVVTTSYNGSSGTTGSASDLIYTIGTNPTTNDQYSTTGLFTSDNTGTLTVTMASSVSGDVFTGVRLNAFEFDVVPEPSTTALLGLGGLALILRRRK